MRFELEEYHRNITEAELIADLQRVAVLLGKKTVTRKEQDSNGRFHSSTLCVRLGKWPDILLRAGLDQSRSPLNIPDAELLADVQHVAALLAKDAVTMIKQDVHGRFHSSTLADRFGSWSNAVERAGLNRARPPINNSDEDLFSNIEEVWMKLGRQPRFREMARPLSKFHVNTYTYRFGSWRKALEAFVHYVGSPQQDIGESKSSQQVPSDLVTCPENKPLESRTISLRLRFLVMRRDNFKCRACGKSPATDSTITLDIDHISAWSKGGPTILENLQTLCTKCNIGKSDLEFFDSPTTGAQNVEA